MHDAPAAPRTAYLLPCGAGAARDAAIARAAKVGEDKNGGKAP
jgi:hypothetical protein